MVCGQPGFADLLIQALADVDPELGGLDFQDAVAEWFEAKGYLVKQEWPAPYESEDGKKRKGRCDLAIHKRGDWPIFVECDGKRPRKKSRLKLIGLGGGWVVCWKSGIVERVPAFLNGEIVK